MLQKCSTEISGSCSFSFSKKIIIIWLYLYGIEHFSRNTYLINIDIYIYIYIYIYIILSFVLDYNLVWSKILESIYSKQTVRFRNLFFYEPCILKNGEYICNFTVIDYFYEGVLSATAHTLTIFEMQRKVTKHLMTTYHPLYPHYYCCSFI